jgi:glycine cleavage system H protein
VDYSPNPQPPGHNPNVHLPYTLIPLAAAAAMGQAHQAQYAEAQRAAAEAAAERLRGLMANRVFTPQHVWMAVGGWTATVGLTHRAVALLGRVLFVSLPAIGTVVTAGASCGCVESVAMRLAVYAPVDGEVIRVNGRVGDEPELIGAEPYEAGWLWQVRLSADSHGGQSLPPDLLSASQYLEATR